MIAVDELVLAFQTWDRWPGSRQAVRNLEAACRELAGDRTSEFREHVAAHRRRFGPERTREAIDRWLTDQEDSAA